MVWLGYIPIALGAVFLLAGIRIVRPTHKMLVETLGKWSRTSEQGFAWIIPLIQRGVYVNITENKVDIPPQKVITKDKLNAEVDAVVYYKVKDVKAAKYNVDDFEDQLPSLTRTTLRAVVGKMTLTDANEKRDEINTNVEKVLNKETAAYGVDVLRVEIQKIEPPEDVQDSMNEVVKAEQEKIAAKDRATATETVADGVKRAEIKEAEGVKRAKILVAEGEAKAIQEVHTAGNKYFVGNAQKLKSLNVAQNSLKDNTKFVIGTKENVVNVLSEMTDPKVIPVDRKGTSGRK